VLEAIEGCLDSWNDEHGGQRMNALAKWMLVGAVGAAAIPAYADNYSVLFTDTTGSGLNATATFSYSDGIFHNFDIDWNGRVFDFTVDANSVAGVGGCNTGKGFAAFDFMEGAACATPASPATPQWGAATWGVGSTFLLSPNYEGFGKSLLSPGPEADSMGTLKLTDLSTHKAPEIDPGSAVAGLALLLGGLMVLRGRLPRGRTR